jgi:predicted RNA binding protein YcfA (HicA-like mRNA interferase family)
MKGPAGGSSHKTFRKPGQYPITIPQHEPIKRIYVEMVRDIVESEESDNENS